MDSEKASRHGTTWWASRAVPFPKSIQSAAMLILTNTLLLCSVRYSHVEHINSFDLLLGSEKLPGQVKQ